MSPPPERVLRLGEAGYPSQLAAAPDPPEKLYLRGDPGLLARPAVAVVGARKAAGVGRQMANRLGGGLARAGVLVVSGCAVGVDAEAHLGALEAGEPTVAVLGGGLDVAAPRSNRKLAERIGREGCLVSEYKAGTAPAAFRFPLRNRIIAGLVRIVVVVEGKEHSGARITARLALEAGREVMAVPGHPLYENSAAPNGLLVDGARPALNVGDVLSELEKLPPMAGVPAWKRPVRARPAGARPAVDPGPPDRRLADRILAALEGSAVTPDGIAESIGAPPATVLALMTQLELTGLVRAHSGGRYARPK